MYKALLLVVVVIIVIAGIRVYNNATTEPADSNIDQTAEAEKITNKIVADTYLDVRTQDEWNQGHVANAVHWDLAKLEQGLFPQLDKNAKILVYCRSGNRAGTALQILKEHGFTNVTNAGAFSDLQSSGVASCSGPDANCK